MVIFDDPVGSFRVASGDEMCPHMSEGPVHFISVEKRLLRADYRTHRTNTRQKISDGLLFLFQLFGIRNRRVGTAAAVSAYRAGLPGISGWISMGRIECFSHGHKERPFYWFSSIVPLISALGIVFLFHLVHRVIGSSEILIQADVF